MSSTAQHVEALLLDFAYGELSASDAQRVQAHLDGCAECRRSLEQLQGVRKVMSLLPHEAAPDGGLESLLAYAEQAARRTQAGPPPKPTWWRKLLAPVTAVVAVAVIGVVAHEVEKEAATPEQVVSSAIAQRVSEAGPQREAKVADEAQALPAAPVAPAPAPAAKKKAEGAKRERARITRAAPVKELAAAAQDEGAEPGRASVTRAAPLKDLAAAAQDEGMIRGGAGLERSEESAQRAQAPGKSASAAPAPGPRAAARPEPAPAPAPRRRMAPVESAPEAEEAERAYAAVRKPAAPAAQTATNAFVTASPTATQLASQAQAAHDRGDPGEEARLLREAAALAPRDRVLMGNLLLRLCDVEYQLGNDAAGARACQRAADEFPGTSTAAVARRRIADHAGRGRASEAPAAPSAPAQTSP